MTQVSQLVPASYSLAAVFAWGASDFIGGYASRRANAFVLTAIAHLSAMLFMGSIAFVVHAPFPPKTAVLWGLAGGLSGGAALAIFYRALATGRMGLTAPVAAVLGAVIPVSFGMIQEGLPHITQIGGFIFAAIGIWLISRSEDGGRPEGIGMAALAGVGFAGYYLCVKQAGDSSALWVAATSKIASFAITSVFILASRTVPKIDRRGLGLGIAAGCMDISGSVLFIRASQTGRLDAAVVLSSLYPAVTVLLARFILDEHFTRWKAVGMLAALTAVPMIALQ